MEQASITNVWAQVHAGLALFSKPFPHEAIALAEAHRDEVAPRLAAELTALATNPSQAPDDYMLHLHAMHLLAWWRDRRGLSPLLALGHMRDHELLEALFGDHLTESFGRCLGSMARGDLQSLMDLADDEQAFVWARSAALAAMKACVVEGDAQRDAVIAYTRGLAQREAAAARAGRSANEWGYDFLNSVVALATDLCAMELLPAIREWFGEKLLDEMHADLEFVETSISEPFEVSMERMRADTYAYFGEPVYTYSLKDGINDGYLTPFKVKQIATTLDEYVFTPDDEVLEGEIEEGRRYEEKDFNRIIEMKQREARRVKLFMGMIDQREKTLVFCATQTHALVVRDLVNQIKANTDPLYCVRVTAADGALGDQYLADFRDSERTIPTILTTSQKLSTGVDARNVRNIVLLRPVNSMIEFKQIIGRGTRLADGKDCFTIHDFVKAHIHFSDPEWDGEPIDPETPEPRRPRQPLEAGEPLPPYEPQPPQTKVVVKLADGKARTVQHMVATSFWSADGKPMSATQFLESLYGRLPEFFNDEDELRRIWSMPDTRRTLLDGLAEKGFGGEQLAEMQKLIDATNSDLFDVLAYVSFARPPRTRVERAESARLASAAEFGDRQRAFVEFVLAQYVRDGVGELDQEKLSPLLRLRYRNAIADAVADLGPPEQIRKVFVDFQRHLYL